MSTLAQNKQSQRFDTNHYSVLKPAHWGYYGSIGLALVLVCLGVYAATTLEHAGHHLSGMNNHIVWGLPHVFAISLIVAASGALNGATLSSVFGLAPYKPYARMSVVVAIGFLIGGLAVLVLDLGRPDRLIVAMTTYNFRSIFSWNIFLYTGFIAISVLYLWMMMEKQFNRHIRQVGMLALIWRLILTTGTGSIFGFLVGRNALDTALLAPLFIALSLVMGTALLSLWFSIVSSWRREAIEPGLTDSLKRFQLWFLLALVYFSAVHHVTNLYVAEHHAVERHVLWGPHSGLFWLGHIVLGVALPAALLFRARASSALRDLVVPSVCALIGCCLLIYVIVIGAQSTPQQLFPGFTVVSSRFGDAGFAAYSASFWEWGLGLGGIAVAILLSLFLMRILPVMPQYSGAIDSRASST